MGKHVHYQVQYCIRNYSYLNGQSLMYESVLMIDDIDLVAKLFEKVNHSPHYGNISVFFIVEQWQNVPQGGALKLHKHKIMTY